MNEYLKCGYTEQQTPGSAWYKLHVKKEKRNMEKHIPKHIGIIPDGNRRWAKEHGMRKQDGYEIVSMDKGTEKLRHAK